VDRRIAVREPMHAISANLNYAMLCAERPELHVINNAPGTVLLADGMPLLWTASRRGTPLPERVTGSDLIFRLAEHAAARGYRLFLLGGPPGVGDEAASALVRRAPGLQIAGAYSPPFRDSTPEEEAALIARIRDARPDLLLVAFGQPKGERWIYDHQSDLGVPFCMQVGASIEFAAGRFRRAPRWMQITGLEWLFRLLQEPRRLCGRYGRNALFLTRRILFGDPPTSEAPASP
jgi:N-acetylglucosaminyldiphosphoundecaprenol N-acetyl-beta-D-mannosaminyltransferase